MHKCGSYTDSYKGQLFSFSKFDLFLPSVTWKAKVFNKSKASD